MAPPACSKGQQRNPDAFLCVVSAQCDSHLTCLDHFLKHDEQFETSEKKMGYFLSSYTQTNSRAREVVFRVQSDFVNTC